MRLKSGALVVAGVLVGAAALLPAISEGKGGPARGARCGQTECRQLSQNCPQDRRRLRDGSCGNESCPQNPRGCRNADSGQAAGPQDSGAPSQQ